MSAGTKRSRSDENECHGELPSKRLRRDIDISSTSRRSLLGRAWDVTSGGIRRAYTWLMHRFTVKTASHRSHQNLGTSSQDAILIHDDDDDEDILKKGGAMPQRTKAPLLPVSKPSSPVTGGAFANPVEDKGIHKKPTTTKQYSGPRGGLPQQSVLSDVLRSQEKMQYERLLDTHTYSCSPQTSIEEVGPSYNSTPSSLPSSPMSGPTQNLLLHSRGIKLLSVDTPRVSLSSAAQRTKLDWSAGNRPPHSSVSQRHSSREAFRSAPQSIPRTVTPVLSSSIRPPQAGLSWADESPLSHITSTPTYSRTQSLRRSDIGSHLISTSSGGDKRTPIHKHDMSRTTSAAATSYPSRSSWLQDWKLRHERDKADYQSRLEAARKYCDLQHEERVKAEDKRHKNLEGLLKSLQITPLSLTTEEEVEEEELKLSFTSEQLQELERVWTGGRMDQVFSEGFNIKITRGDLMTLHSLEWLNDEVINFYLNMVVDQANRQQLCKIHLFNSFFYTNIMSKGYSGVRRWTKRVDIFSKDLILLPVHLGMHWCLASIDFRKKQICYFDSLKGSNVTCFNVLRDYLVSEAKDKKQMEYDVSDWTFEAPKDIPAQYNGSDCGVFTCMYARHKAKDKPFSFTQKDMPRIRMMMVLEIVSKQFL